MPKPDLDRYSTPTPVDVGLARPTFNTLTSALDLLRQGRVAAAESSLGEAERWARILAISLQSAENAADGLPKQTGFVVTSDELRTLHSYVSVAREYLSIGRVRECTEATLEAWRRAKAATQCLEAAAMLATEDHAHVLH